MADKNKAIGGQAVIEGVMMRGKMVYAMAVRTPSNNIEIVKEPLKQARYSFWKLPVIRGVVAFADSLVLGMKIITRSAEIAGMDTEEEPGKVELFLQKIFGDKWTDYILYLSVAFSVVLSVGLFMLLPTWLASFLRWLPLWAISIAEGLLRIAILIGYMLLISRMSEIQRVFQYHGAEHKTIHCYENDQDLIVEHVRNCSRFHKRCGTSFLFLVMIISMVVFFFVRVDEIWLRLLLRVLFVPLIAGMSYECIRWAGRSQSVFVKVVSYPGICLQKITTSEPDDAQIEVAIAAMKEVLEDENERSAGMGQANP